MKKKRKKLSLEDSIRYCIKHKLKFDITYSDTDGTGAVLTGYRNLSPAALGILKSTGNIAVRAYLNDGVSQSNHSPNWRLFLLKRITDYDVKFEKFRINSLYRENDKHMEIVDVQLKKAFENLIIC